MEIDLMLLNHVQVHLITFYTRIHAINHCIIQFAIRYGSFGENHLKLPTCDESATKNIGENLSN
jgi:hypothetical protein